MPPPGLQTVCLRPDWRSHLKLLYPKGVEYDISTSDQKASKPILSLVTIFTIDLLHPSCCDTNGIYRNVCLPALVNPLECRGNYSATSNNIKLVHLSLMGGLLHLVTSTASVPITPYCGILIRCSAVLTCPLKG